MNDDAIDDAVVDGKNNYNNNCQIEFKNYYYIL